MHHVRAGIRAILRQPALMLGEIAWRWAFGAAAWALVILAIRRILEHVDITQAELLIARHSDLFLIADACARIVVQVLPQLARECLVLIPAIAVLWIAAATVGRAITLQALLLSCVILSEDAPADPRAPILGDVGCRRASESKDPCVSRLAPDARTHFGQLTFLHALRVFFTLATFIALLGALFLAGMTIPVQNLAAAAAASVVATGLVGLFWSLVNWFLALSPIWIVCDGHTALKSIADSLDLFRRRPGPYAGITSWFGLLRAIALAAAIIASLIASQASPASAIALYLVIALVYFAVADGLYIARLAAFVALDKSYQLSVLSSHPIAPRPQPISSPEM